MFNVCVKCGSWTQDAQVLMEKEGAFRKCSSCGDLFPFQRLPIFFLSGCSGVGKTTLGSHLYRDAALPVIPLESDILWSEQFNTPDDDYRTYRETWLRLCKNYNQGGKPTLLIGCVAPRQIENCIERRYFSQSHYLVLVRSEEEIIASLRSRPSWRNASSHKFINEHLEYQSWLIENAPNTEPAMELIDISHCSLEESITRVKDRICRLMGL